MRRADRGMTLAEVLAAMALVAIVLPVVFGAILFANRSTVLAQRRDLAAFRADQLLQEAIATRTWEEGDTDGAFEDGATWKVAVADWDVEALTRVTAQVSYTVQGTVYTESIVRIVRSEEVEE